MAKIIWTKRAFSQFERSIRFIREEQGLTYARIVYEKIIESINLLEHHPLMGTREPALMHKKSTYHYIVVWSYKIIYRANNNEVVIARVFHTSRNPKKLKGA